LLRKVQQLADGVNFKPKFPGVTDKFEALYGLVVILPPVASVRGNLRKGSRMADSCCGANVRFEGLDPRYRRALWTVIAINAAMFVVEITAGHIAGSQALQADALDFLGDTLTYGLSLAVIGRSLQIRSHAAMLKGVSLTLMGVWVFGSTLYHVLILGVPRAEIMGIIGFMALAANLARHRLRWGARMAVPRWWTRPNGVFQR
jgi:hypothetical protein